MFTKDNQTKNDWCNFVPSLTDNINTGTDGYEILKELIVLVTINLNKTNRLKNRYEKSNCRYKYDA